MLDDAFGPKTKHEIFGDFKPLNQATNPAFYVHVVKKNSE